jgi:hypothetical protein
MIKIWSVKIGLIKLWLKLELISFSSGVTDTLRHLWKLEGRHGVT